MMTNLENKNKSLLNQGVLIEIGFFSLLFLIFFQLLTAFIEATYAFGLLGTSFPIEAVCVIFLFAPILWFVLPKKRLGILLSLLVFLILATRMAEGFLDTRWKMIVSGLGVGSFLLLFPLLLNLRGRNAATRQGYSMGVSLLFAVVFSIFLRSLCSGNDLSDFGIFRFLSWGLALLALVLFWLYRQSTEISKAVVARNTQVAQGGRPVSRRGKALLYMLGIVSIWVMLYFAFVSPAVIARWTGFDLLPILIVLLLSLSFFAFIILQKPAFLEKLSARILILWNVLFLMALVLAVLAHQVPFPALAEGYPLSEPAVPWWGGVSLYISLLLSPVVFLNFMVFVRDLSLEAASLRRLGGLFTLGGLYFLLIIFAHIFTTVYDYIPVVGPLLRDRFWLVHLIPGLGMLVSVLLPSGARWRVGPSKKIGQVLFVGVLTIAFLSLMAIFVQQARPSQVPMKVTLRILTYNIQQGYSADGLKSFQAQLDVIREADADIIGLQESDTTRIAGGNSDVVRFIADQLDLYTYYGPKTVTGTFGIALLSRYPIENPETFFMYSEGEQTAAILAEVTVDGQVFNILVTHLGNGGPMIQQQQVLERLQGLDHVIAIGDYNFRPDGDQYGLTTQTLADSWLLTDVPNKTGQGIDPLQRIDHIFVTAGTSVLMSQYIVSPASDHPAMLTEIGW